MTIDPRDPFGWGECDRIEVNETGGMVFYGYDDDDGTTTWYTRSGDCDSVTPTPNDDDFY